MDENFDFKEAVSKIQEMFQSDEGRAQLGGIMDMLGGNSKEAQDSSFGGGFDPSMLLKIQKIMSMTSNSSDSERANLLRSLKPFLKEERQGKVDKAIQLMNMSKIISLFKDDL
ncbi:MAG: hypothetical protein IKC07_03855 [Clostridia bacterium]|nr:hypothetical protein [Clostridia bacterium]